MTFYICVDILLFYFVIDSRNIWGARQKSQLLKQTQQSRQPTVNIVETIETLKQSSIA
jgi:hypothetical protein